MQIEKPKSNPLKPVFFIILAIILIAVGLNVVQSRSSKQLDDDYIEADDVFEKGEGETSFTEELTLEELERLEFEELESIEANDAEVEDKSVPQEYRKVKLEPLKVIDAPEEDSKNVAAESPQREEVDEVKEDVAVATPKKEVKIEAPAKTFSTPQAVSQSLFVHDSPLILHWFLGDVKVVRGKDSREFPAQRGQKLFENDVIKVGPKGEANLSIKDKYQIRLKGDTEMKHIIPLVSEKFAGKKETIYRMELLSGTVLGATTGAADPLEKVVFISRGKSISVDGATYRIDDEEGVPAKVGVLRGGVRVVDEYSNEEPVFVSGLQNVEFEQGVQAPEPKKVSESDWVLMKEAYELLERDSSEEADQMDLSLQSGELFQYVFDHGTFFTPKVGFARRNFYEDEDTGEIILEIEYDVFPYESFVGGYFLTRNFDANKHAGFEFEARYVDGEGYPKDFGIEIKSRFDVLQTHKVGGLRPDWQPYKFEFYRKKETPVVELTFVFLNSEVGEHKKGIVEFRGFKLLPVTEEIKKEALVREIQKKNANAVKKSTALLTTHEMPEKAGVVQKKIPAQLSQKTFKALKKADEARKIANTVPKTVSITDL